MATPAIEQNSNTRVSDAPEQELTPPASVPKVPPNQQKRQKTAAVPAPKDAAAHADPPLALGALKTLMRGADADFAARRQVCEAYCALTQSLVDRFSGAKSALQRGHAMRVADLVTAAVAREFNPLASPTTPRLPDTPPGFPSDQLCHSRHMGDCPPPDATRRAHRAHRDCLMGGPTG